MSSDALSAELDRELRALEGERSAQRDGEDENDQEGMEKGAEADGPRERKRSLEDDAELDSDESAARKKARVDGEDVEMEEGETQPCSPQTEDGELKSASRETVVPGREVSAISSGQGATSSGTETMSTEASGQPAERVLVDDEAMLHQSPEPVTATLNLLSQTTTPLPAPSIPLQPPAQPQAGPSQPIATLSDLPPLPTTLTALPPYQSHVKNEPQEPPLSPQTTPSKRRLGIRHIDLAYHTSKDEMTCRMC